MGRITISALKDKIKMLANKIGYEETHLLDEDALLKQVAKVAINYGTLPFSKSVTPIWDEIVKYFTNFALIDFEGKLVFEALKISASDFRSHLSDILKELHESNYPIEQATLLESTIFVLRKIGEIMLFNPSYTFPERLNFSCKLLKIAVADLNDLGYIPFA